MRFGLQKDKAGVLNDPDYPAFHGKPLQVGEVIPGERSGDVWVGEDRDCKLTFSKLNTFEVGEMCAVPRTDNRYT
eukprot:scaffold199753_cov20-Prasinocladus_malaysianus.AAC.1